MIDRAAAKMLAVRRGPEGAVAHLRGQGWDAKATESGLAVRKPGEKEWRVVDPSHAEWRDLLDIAPEIVTGLFAGTGAWIGTVGGPLSWLTVPAGAATGGAAAKGLENIALEAMGVDVSPGEAAAQMATEGAVMGTAEVALKGAGTLLRPVGRKAGEVLGKAGQAIGGRVTKHGKWPRKRTAMAPMTRHEAELKYAGKSLGELQEIAQEKGIVLTHVPRGQKSSQPKPAHMLIQEIFEKQPGAAERIAQREADVGKFVEGTRTEYRPWPFMKKRPPGEEERELSMEFYKKSTGELRNMPQVLTKGPTPKTVEQIKQDLMYNEQGKPRGNAWVQRASEKYAVKGASGMTLDDAAVRAYETQVGMVTGRGRPTAPGNISIIDELQARRGPGGNPTKIKSPAMRNLVTMGRRGRPGQFDFREPSGRQILGGAIERVGGAVGAPGRAAFSRVGQIVGKLTGARRGLVGLIASPHVAAAATAYAGGPIGMGLAASFWAGEGISWVGKELMRDITGTTLMKIAVNRRIPEIVRTWASQAHQVLKERGVQSYRVFVYLGLQNPQIRKALNEALPGGENEPATAGEVQG
jgi:hypothetical protein